MNRSQMVRSIYAEFRRALPEEESGADLLQAAADLVDLLQPSQPVPSKMSFRTGGVPFEEWDLCRAMADGGYRVFRHEEELRRLACFEDSDLQSGRNEVMTWMREHLS